MPRRFRQRCGTRRRPHRTSGVGPSSWLVSSATRTIGRTVPRLLREAGHDVLAIIEQDRGVSDHEVFELCLQTHRVLVTRDLDFSDIRRFPLGSHDGLIVLRYPADATFEELAAAIVRGLEHAGDQLLGALLVVTPGTLRLRSPDLSDGD